jgi:hypothetical protein
LILEIEREFNLGLGGFVTLGRDEQAQLLAWHRVRSDPEHRIKRHRKKKGTKERIKQAFERRK